MHVAPWCYKSLDGLGIFVWDANKSKLKSQYIYNNENKLDFVQLCETQIEGI